MQNITALQSDVKFVRLQNGKLAAQSDVLELRLQEMRKIFPAQTLAIQQLGIRMNKARQMSTTILHTEKTIETILRDSLILDTIPVKVLNYTDRWFDIKGIAVGNSQQLSITSTDTLIQVVFRGERKNQKLWIFSPRKLQQRVSVSNPNAVIRYSEMIQIHKR